MKNKSLLMLSVLMVLAIFSPSSAIGGKVAPDKAAPRTSKSKRGKQVLPVNAKILQVAGHVGFLALPEGVKVGQKTPWLWYLPSDYNLPGKLEQWMIDKCLANGIAVAGIDLSGDFGTPAGRVILTAFHKEVTQNRGLTKKACMLARSYGGLQMYNWAAEHPESVACLAGIYPVCNMDSYPGLKAASRKYGMSQEQLVKKLKEHNPIDRLAPLAKAKVPIYHIHGDVDTLVPAKDNSMLLAKRYKALGGDITINVCKGQGHNYWRGFFEDEAMAAFIIKHAKRVASLPKVLIFGDSISGGYSKSLIKLLDGKAEVIKLGSVAGYRIKKEPLWQGRPAGNLNFGNAMMCVTDFDRFKRHLSETKYDVIHFNFGLNDIFRGRNGTWHSSPEKYAEHLSKIVALLKTNGAKIIWATTTPIPANAPHCPEGDDLIYNAAAEKVMKKNNIPINDLHSVVTKWDGYDKWRKGNDVHFSGAVYSKLAKQAAETIIAQLETPGMTGGANKQQLPNIIFILADDMGYGDLSCYGAEKIQTPNIDRLAKEGILFTDGHCGASTCTPTRYGLLTGRHNWRTWLKYSALSTSAPLLIEEDRMTVASFLKSAGYSTSIVGKWHLGYGREEDFEDNRGEAPPNYWETRGKGPNWNGELKPGPLEVGFDYSYVIPVANSFPPYVIVENHHVEGLRKDSPIGKLQSRNHGKMEGGEGARWKDEELVDKLTSKLVSQLESFAKEEKPFFLYYAPHQPHGPWRPNRRFKGTSQAGVYGDVIQELDWSVGEMLKTLDRLGLSENTLVIFSSDNGSSGRNFNGHRPNGPLRGGKGDLTEGGHRVPFFARWPGKIKPGTRSKETISQTDMMATFAAIIEKKLPPGAGPDSYNVLAALLGQKLPDPERPLVMSSGGTGALSIRAGKWKLLVGQGDCGYREFFSKRPHPTPKLGDPPAQLYNLEEDLAERNNLYTQHSEIVHRLKVGLEKIKADENYNPTALEQPKDALSLEQLNALFSRPTDARPKSKATLTKIGGKIAAVSSFQPAGKPRK